MGHGKCKDFGADMAKEADPEMFPGNNLMDLVPLILFLLGVVVSWLL